MVGIAEEVSPSDFFLNLDAVKCIGVTNSCHSLYKGSYQK